jgi:hypothetical protein
LKQTKTAQATSDKKGFDGTNLENKKKTGIQLSIDGCAWRARIAVYFVGKKDETGIQLSIDGCAWRARIAVYFVGKKDEPRKQQLDYLSILNYCVLTYLLLVLDKEAVV